MRARSLLWSLATVVVAALVSFLVARATLDRDSRGSDDSSPRAEHHGEAELHEWLHENLGITAEQESRLLPIESRYESERRRLHAAIGRAGEKLAAAIRENEPGSEAIAAARRDLTRLQGELQQATLDHFFAMKEHLTPEQGERLLEWTRQSILDGYHE